MRGVAAVFFALIIGVCSSLFAEAEKSEEAKGVDMVFDTATVIIRKTNAFFQGNLEFTMPADTDKRKFGESYTENAIGRKVPNATR